MEFQNQLYTLRKQKGLSQEELAHLIGVSRQAVQKWEAGTARPDLDNLTALARYFGVTLDELVTGQRPQIQDASAGAPNPPAGPHYVVYPTGVTYYCLPCQWHYEYKSKRTFLGLPLVHINLSRRGAAQARGILAVGNTAVGGLAIGGASVGLVSLGGVSVGLLGLGGLTVGLLASFGGLAVGAIAFGGCAVGGLAAFGGLAVGNVAMGGCAVGNVAMGAAAVGKTAIELGDGNSPTPQDWAAFRQGIEALGSFYSPVAWLFSLLSPS